MDSYLLFHTAYWGRRERLENFFYSSFFTGQRCPVHSTEAEKWGSCQGFTPAKPCRPHFVGDRAGPQERQVPPSAFVCEFLSCNSYTTPQPLWPRDEANAWLFSGPVSLRNVRNSLKEKTTRSSHCLISPFRWNLFGSYHISKPINSASPQPLASLAFVDWALVCNGHYPATVFVPWELLVACNCIPNSGTKEKLTRLL